MSQKGSSQLHDWVKEMYLVKNVCVWGSNFPLPSSLTTNTLIINHFYSTNTICNKKKQQVAPCIGWLLYMSIVLFTYTHTEAEARVMRKMHNGKYYTSSIKLN